MALTDVTPAESARSDRQIPAAFIAEHGLIGDLQTAALVATDGTIDWFCCPRFDSPSVFARILDQRRGGHFRIAPVENCVAKQLYFPDTAVLITRFMSEDGVAEIVDFMPIADNPKVVTDNHRIVRIIRGIRGEMQMKLECAPRFDYARAPHSVTVTEHGAVLKGAGLELTLHGAPGLERQGENVVTTLTVRANETVGVVLESASRTPPRPMAHAEVWPLLEATARFWRNWIDHSTYRGRWREMVDRAAMTLKLMTYAPTGALVAAPTAALPEQLGGERNWDYRFTWVRDASYSVGALLALGYTEEAQAFMVWLRDRFEEHVGTSSGPLKIMYRVDGSSDLVEESLDHLEGYQGSRPVRIGNGAADQLQLDIYGEAMFALSQTGGVRPPIAHRGWKDMAHIIDWLVQNWDQPDEGIWETRGGRRDFIYGRVMSWVALDRAVRLARELGRPADLVRWTAARDAIYEQILDRGWNPKRNAFVQYHGTDVMDASVLMMPITGFVVPSDPMWLSTLDAIDEELVSDSLVYRYNPSASPDGLTGNEGTFSICTFWYVDALARSGRLEQARYVFEKMLTYANHVGLYSEEIGPTGEQLGNFPQAFSHLSLIGAAVTLNNALDRSS
ncbi:MAG: glycoside hydrolase family 15 protein [Chloroflexi bacterium]|nr:glycoside hydrolase family 15 protein [Chloroflexota bacterium]MBV9602836.1 glycoside hydrolase family 15 protein [Chloroflexota bacterium]